LKLKIKSEEFGGSDHYLPKQIKERLKIKAGVASRFYPYEQD